VHSLLAIFRLRQRSLVRAVALSLSGFALSLHLGGFPHIESLHSSHWQVAALALALWGMAETGRCLRRRWSLYHGGVLLLLYSNLLIVCMSAFLIFFP